LKRTGPAFSIYISILFLLTILPINSSDNSLINNTFILEVRLDYLLHALLYFPWLFLAVKATKAGHIIALLYGLLFAAGTEVLQLLLPYRTFNINDLLANVLGLLSGLILVIPFGSDLHFRLFRNGK
jgi:glycopeptide antibiotics resistance protein